MLFMPNPYAPGRRVRIIKTKPGALGAQGLEGTIVDKPSNSGLLSDYKAKYPDAVRVQTGKNSVWLIGRPEEIKLEFL